MISIDNISFEFIAQDKPFVYKLYADWDNFCQDIIEPIIDEELSVFDGDITKWNIEKLDLNIGPIREECFFKDFPVRFREELRRAIQATWQNEISSVDETNHKRTEESDRELLGISHYLIYGVCTNGINDAEFDLQFEIERILTRDARMIMKLIQKSFDTPTALDQLVSHLEGEFLEKMLLVWLECTDIAECDKRYAVSSCLMNHPKNFLRFLDKVKWNSKLLALVSLERWQYPLISLSTTEIEKMWKLVNILSTTLKCDSDSAMRTLEEYGQDLCNWLITNLNMLQSIPSCSQEEFKERATAVLRRCMEKYGSVPYMNKESLTWLLLNQLFGTENGATILTLIDEGLKEYPTIAIEPVVEVVKKLRQGIAIRTHEYENFSVSPESISTHNAGLALLTPWFSRLFSILGLLDKERKDFRNIESRIKAVFVIQRLVTSESKEYRESELAFNRLLVNCPFSEPLPKTMDLDEDTLEIIDSMLAGVKDNWPQLKKTSIGGFQRNFIQRSGHLERQHNKLILTVESKPFDTLLDALPWSYKLIRFPWLEKRICVSWRDKE